jgi:hypothetical protein
MTSLSGIRRLGRPRFSNILVNTAVAIFRDNDFVSPYIARVVGGVSEAKLWLDETKELVAIQ